MNWYEMTPEQRDALIAEKVMEWQPKECNPDPKQMVVGMLDEKSYGYACYKCGSHGRVDKKYYKHLEATPRYSTDMNAAWKIITHYSIHAVLLERQFFKTTDRYGDDVHLWECSFEFGGTSEKLGKSVYAAGKTPQEAICKASLRAVGVNYSE